MPLLPLLALLALTLLSPASADIIVAANGTDAAGCGTAGNPACRTIAYARRSTDTSLDAIAIEGTLQGPVSIDLTDGHPILLAGGTIRCPSLSPSADACVTLLAHPCPNTDPSTCPNVTTVVPPTLTSMTVDVTGTSGLSAVRFVGSYFSSAALSAVTVRGVGGAESAGVHFTDGFAGTLQADGINFRGLHSGARGLVWDVPPNMGDGIDTVAPSGVFNNFTVAGGSGMGTVVRMRASTSAPINVTTGGISGATLTLNIVTVLDNSTTFADSDSPMLVDAAIGGRGSQISQVDASQGVGLVDGARNQPVAMRVSAEHIDFNSRGTAVIDIDVTFTGGTFAPPALLQCDGWRQTACPVTSLQSIQVIDLTTSTISNATTAEHMVMPLIWIQGAPQTPPPQAINYDIDITSMTTTEITNQLLVVSVLEPTTRIEDWNATLSGSRADGLWFGTIGSCLLSNVDLTSQVRRAFVSLTGVQAGADGARPNATLDGVWLSATADSPSADVLVQGTMDLFVGGLHIEQPSTGGATTTAVECSGQSDLTIELMDEPSTFNGDELHTSNFGTNCPAVTCDSSVRAAVCSGGGGGGGGNQSRSLPFIIGGIAGGLFTAVIVVVLVRQRRHRHPHHSEYRPLMQNA